jgi:FtsK/SpoIIIE family
MSTTVKSDLRKVLDEQSERLKGVLAQASDHLQVAKKSAAQEALNARLEHTPGLAHNPLVSMYRSPHVIPLGAGFKRQVIWDTNKNAHLFVAGHRGKGKTTALHNILFFALHNPQEWEVTIVNIGGKGLGAYSSSLNVEYISNVSELHEFMDEVLVTEITNRRNLETSGKRKLIVVDDLKKIYDLSRPDEGVEGHSRDYVRKFEQFLTESQGLGMHFVLSTSDMNKPFFADNLVDQNLLRLAVGHMSIDESDAFLGSDSAYHISEDNVGRAILADSAQEQIFQGYYVGQSDVDAYIRKLNS